MTELLVPQIHLFELIEDHEMIINEEIAIVQTLTLLNIRYKPEQRL